MTEILIGTSGYYYDDWKGVFYPDDLPKSGYLEFYTNHFKTVELNYTYYKLPDARQSGQMVSRSGGKIEFVVKAFRGLTHEISVDLINEILPRFIEGIAPFADSAVLAGILLQFPQSFHYTPENRIYLKSLIDGLAPLPVFVEFRGKDWLKEKVFDALRELDTGFVCVDEPDLPSLIPPFSISTSKFAYIRFHGRNKKNWYGTDAAKRYDYLYSEKQLREWLPRIAELKKNTEKLYVFFNNHARSQAVTNAKMLINLLKES